MQGAAFLLVITMFLSNILGFLRDLILANTLSLSILDTYYAAFSIPDFLFNLFILGAISSAFIPVYLDVRTKQSEEAAWHLTYNLITSALILLAVLGLFLFIFMPSLLPHFVPGFDAAKIADTVPLARILLLSPFLFAVSYVFGGVLNAQNKFFTYAIAPLVYNTSIIIGGILAPRFGVMGVAWAVVAGAFFHVLIQYPALKSVGYHFKFTFDPLHANVRRVIRLMIPRSISLGMGQIVFIALMRIGSLLPSGSISIYKLTNNFQTTPVAIFAASIGTAVFPMLGAAFSAKDDDQYRQYLTDSLRGMLFFIIPSSVLLWILRAHIIRLYLALNHQTWEDTIRAIDTFSWFILALAAQGLSLILIRAYYARQDTQTPMIISIASGLIIVVAAWLLSGVIPDVPVLSLAFAIGAIIEAIVLLSVFLYRYPHLLNLKQLSNTIVVSSIIALVAGLLARGTLSVVSEGAVIHAEGLGTQTVASLFTALVLAGLVGLSSYLFFAYYLKRNELAWLMPKRAIKSIPIPDSETIANDEGI